MSRKEDPVQIMRLSLKPVRAVIKRSNRWHGSSFIRVCLDSDARVVSDGQEVVDYLEAVLSSRVVDARNVRNLGVLGCRVVFQKGEDGKDPRRRDVDCEFVFPDGELLDVSWEGGEEISPVGMQGFGLSEVLVGGVDNGGLKGAKFCWVERELGGVLIKCEGRAWDVGGGKRVSTRSFESPWVLEIKFAFLMLEY